MKKFLFKIPPKTKNNGTNSILAHFLKKVYIKMVSTKIILHNNSKHNSDSSMVDKDFSRV